MLLRLHWAGSLEGRQLMGWCLALWWWPSGFFTLWALWAPLEVPTAASVSVLLEQGQSVSSQTALRGKLGFILPSLQFWAVLGLPEVNQRWGKGWKERKEISTRMLSVQETVKVQGRKGCVNRGCVCRYGGAPRPGWSSPHGSRALCVYLLLREEKMHLVTLKQPPVVLH